MGPKVVTTSTGEAHKMLRRCLDPAFSPNSVRDYVAVLDRTVLKVLKGYADSIEEYQNTLVLRKFALRMLVVSIFQQENEERLTSLDKDIEIWFKGFESMFPYTIPGTIFGKAKQARKRAIANIEVLVQEFEDLCAKDSSMKKLDIAWSSHLRHDGRWTSITVA